MVEITGSAQDRAAAAGIAEWCARELAKARQTGHLETRPFVQNADLIVAALREFADRNQWRPIEEAKSLTDGTRIVVWGLPIDAQGDILGSDDDKEGLYIATVRTRDPTRYSNAFELIVTVGDWGLRIEPEFWMLPGPPRS